MVYEERTTVVSSENEWRRVVDREGPSDYMTPQSSWSDEKESLMQREKAKAYSRLEAWQVQRP